MSRCRSGATCLLGLLLALVAGPSLAQVPQHTTFTGRLLDAQGSPIAGPVDVTLRLFDAPMAGTQLYSEQHLSTALDATGGFSVPLGQGTSPSGTYGADLFSDLNRWLEIAIGPQVFGPRHILGSAPWALVAERANEIVRDPNAPRFEDCGNGTVADHQTGLLWEQKTGTPGSVVICEVTPCPDPHDVQNSYEWSDTGTDPDGGAFTDFLAKLNDPGEGLGCFAGHCDWRLPNVVEIHSILDCSHFVVFVNECIDPIFGPTWGGAHWTASTSAPDPAEAWTLQFDGGQPANTRLKEAIGFPDGFPYPVRAIRRGSCR